MRFQRLLIALATLGTGLLLAAPAQADPYPATPPDVDVSTGTVSAGGGVTFSGSGYAAGETIIIDVTYSNTGAALSEESTGRFVTAAFPVPEVEVGRTTADSNGDFSVTLQLNQAGTATLTAIGVTSGVTQSQQVTVLTPAAAEDEGLAVTGTPTRVGPEILGGVAAVLVGFVLVMLAFRLRRRNNTEES